MRRRLEQRGTWVSPGGIQVPHCPRQTRADTGRVLPEAERSGLPDHLPPLRALEGVAPNGDDWALYYGAVGPWGGRQWLALVVNGLVQQGGEGYGVPGETELACSGGLKEGEGNYHLYGLVTARVLRVRAEGTEERSHSEVATVPLPAATTDDGQSLRVFALVRPPVDDVAAVVGFDVDGLVVQRVPL
jgi:hypothetical protein